MTRAWHVGALLLLSTGLAICGQKTAVKEPPPPPVKKNQVKGGLPKGAQKGAGRIINPGSRVANLLRMTPEERNKALEGLPPKQQEQLRKQFDAFDSLPKEQQTLQLRRIDKFQQLTPSQQMEVRGLVRQANELPPQRKRQVGIALTQLQSLPDAQREEMLNRPAFKARFSPEEYRIISHLADTFLPPM